MGEIGYTGGQPDQNAEPPSFGDPRVDEAVARTHGLDELPVQAHAAVFEQVHQAFTDALSDAGTAERSADRPDDPAAGGSGPTPPSERGQPRE